MPPPAPETGRERGTKQTAARRRGKCRGGYPVLGYDAGGPSGLRINPEEAEWVRAIFKLYAEYGSMAATLRELRNRGWRMKSRTTGGVKRHEGKEFGRAALLRLIGKCRFKSESALVFRLQNE